MFFQKEKIFIGIPRDDGRGWLLDAFHARHGYCLLRYLPPTDFAFLRSLLLQLAKEEPSASSMRTNAPPVAQTMPQTMPKSGKSVLYFPSFYRFQSWSELHFGKIGMRTKVFPLPPVTCKRENRSGKENFSTVFGTCAFSLPRPPRGGQPRWPRSRR